MSLYKYTQSFVLLCIVLVCSHDIVRAAVDADVLDEAKDAYTQAFQTASEHTKRRQELERSLRQFDAKVEHVKQDLLASTQERVNVRLQIDDRRRLVAALTDEMIAVHDSHTQYQNMVDEQRRDVRSLVRLMAARELVVHDTGPIVGGPTLRRMLRGSLGDSIEEDLSRNALLSARKELLTRLTTFAADAEEKQSHLQILAAQLETELSQLEARGTALDETVGQHAAALDRTWKQQVLTEKELQQVQDEVAGVSGNVMHMQANVVGITRQLKESKLKDIQAQLDVQHEQERVLQDKKNVLLSVDARLRAMQDAEQEGKRVLQESRNTELKLYKRIDDLEWTIKVKQQSLEQLLSASGSKSADVSSLLADIDTRTRQLVLMKTGISTDAALQYVHVQQAAEGATTQRAVLATQIDALDQQLAVVAENVKDLLSQIDTTEKTFALTDVPPLFTWPVRGTLTAGYLDPDYFDVFHIEHKAVDIAVMQGTPVHTVADGVVYAVKLGGKTGYTYVLIGHRDGYSSLYGHLSEVFVQPGDVLEDGQVLGLSGGLPGTNGSGKMTTGAHVHLEMMKNGEHFNPLDVLGK